MRDAYTVVMGPKKRRGRKRGWAVVDPDGVHMVTYRDEITARIKVRDFWGPGYRAVRSAEL